MSEVTLERTYKRARIYARILEWSLGLFLIGIIGQVWESLHYLDRGLPRSGGELLLAIIPIITVLVSFLTLVASAIGTTSTILLGWREERRQSEEFKLKIRELDLQLQEAQAKAVPSTKDT
jgi:hypothetical protein